MDISITKPYKSSEDREIEFDFTTLRFTGYELTDLFDQIDNEIHMDTRDDLLKEIEDLKAERDELLLENDELKEGTI